MDQPASCCASKLPMRGDAGFEGARWPEREDGREFDFVKVSTYLSDVAFGVGHYVPLNH